MATYEKRHMFRTGRPHCLTEWSKILTQEQEKRQTNSTPDSSSGIVSDYHGMTSFSEVSETTKASAAKEHVTVFTQRKKLSKKQREPFSPEKNVEKSIFRKMEKLNKALEPIEEQLCSSNNDKQTAKVGDKMKKHVKSLFQPFSRPQGSKASKSSSTASTTDDTLKETFLFFDVLTDSVITLIFSFLTSNHLCKSAMVCKRWYQLVWNPRLWTCIEIHSHKVNADAAVRSLTRALSIDNSRTCLIVQTIDLSHCASLTDRGVFQIAKRCPELKELVLDACVQVSNIAIFEVVSRCTSLQVLSIAGCPYITCISLTPEANLQATTFGKQVFLSHLDMSECVNVDDSSLHLIATYLSNLVHLYLRRCFKVSDLGVQYVASYCPKVQELSLSDCTKVSDLGLRDISRLGTSLKYLSIAKCRKVSDTGIRCLASSCSKLRYLNMRGCDRVSDDGLIFLSSKCTKLKSLDVGACTAGVTDRSLVALAHNCRHLRRLSIRQCCNVSDQGLRHFAMAAPQLQQINLINCPLSPSSSFKALSQYCHDCIIEYKDSESCT